MRSAVNQEISTEQRQLLQQLQGSLPVGPLSRLQSGDAALDRFFGGGLVGGKLLEWGLPSAKEGWQLLLPYLAAASAQGRCLWIGQTTEQQPLAPAWYAAGARPENLYFLNSTVPLKEAKEVFAHPLFAVICLNGPKGLRGEDLAFLAAQARTHNKWIFLLRPFFLGPNRGNIWAGLRVNAWKRQPNGPWVLRGLKGVGGDLLWQPQGAP